MKKKSKRGRPKGSKNKSKELIKSIKTVSAEVQKQIGKSIENLKSGNVSGPIDVPVVKRGRGRPKKNQEPIPAPANLPVKEMEDGKDVLEEVSDNPEEVNALLATKRRGRPKGSKNTGEVEEIFKRVQKVDMTSGGWTRRYQIFKDVPKEFHVDEDMTARGSRVLVSVYPDFYRIYLKRYHQGGTQGYPSGGIEVFNANNHRTESYHYEQVAVHPKGGSIRIAETDDGGVQVDQYVPVSNRDERDARKMARREKKMAKENKKKFKQDIKALKIEIKDLNQQKKILKPKQRKIIQEQIKEKKNKIEELKKELTDAVKLSNGEGTIVPL